MAVRGPGDFFGEMALIEGRPRSASVRARTDVEVTTMGAQVFSRISKALAPLQQRLVDTLRQRTARIWTRMPDAYAVLSRETVASFVEPATHTLPGDAAFEDALALFAVRHADTVYVVEDDGRIAGVVTRSDLLRVVDVVSARPPGQRQGVSIRHFMTPDPVVVALADAASLAALLMWNRGLKSLPVVTTADKGRLAGCLRAETLMHQVLQLLMLTNHPAAMAAPVAGPESIVSASSVS